MLTKLRVPLVIGILSLAVLSHFVTPYMLVASTAYLMLWLGLLSRRHNLAMHRNFMLAGVGLDIALVLVLEIQRNAIKTAVSFTLEPLQQSHIGASTIALLLYFPLLYLGAKCFNNTATPEQRILHKRLGIVTFCLRSLGFLLMFSMLKSHP